MTNFDSESIIITGTFDEFNDNGTFIFDAKNETFVESDAGPSLGFRPGACGTFERQGEKHILAINEVDEMGSSETKTQMWNWESNEGWISGTKYNIANNYQTNDISYF